MRAACCHFTGQLEQLAKCFFYTLGHSKDSQSLLEDMITGAEEEYFSRQQIRELKFDYYHHLLDRKGNEKKIATTFLHCSVCTPYLHKCNMYARRSYTDECNMAALPDVPTLMSATWLHCERFQHRKDMNATQMQCKTFLH